MIVVKTDLEKIPIGCYRCKFNVNKNLLSIPICKLSVALGGCNFDNCPLMEVEDEKV